MPSKILFNETPRLMKKIMINVAAKGNMLGSIESRTSCTECASSPIVYSSGVETLTQLATNTPNTSKPRTEALFCF